MRGNCCMRRTYSPDPHVMLHSLRNTSDDGLSVSDRRHSSDGRELAATTRGKQCMAQNVSPDLPNCAPLSARSHPTLHVIRVMIDHGIHWKGVALRETDLRKCCTQCFR